MPARFGNYNTYNWSVYKQPSSPTSHYTTKTYKRYNNILCVFARQDSGQVILDYYYYRFFFFFM